MTPQELKSSILQLAIQGKLVEQRSDEGTGEELYSLIQSKKKTVIKTDKIKKEKSLSEITEDEIPFDIPESWKWVRLGEISYINGGFAFKSTNYTDNGVRVIRISDFNELGFVDEKIVRYPYDETLNQYVLNEKNILLCMTGGTVGKSLLVTHMDEKMVVNQRVATIKIETVLPEYVYQVILAPITQKVIQHSKNSTNDNISMDTIKEFLIPLPPIAEQKRIVAKIEALLPLIEYYEQAWSKLEEFNKRFPVDMQKSILQTAIQGKLVEQRQEEGTGEELYQQIQAEKQSLIKAGKIKKEKPQPEITEDNIPFDIPDSWKWVRVAQIVTLNPKNDIDDALETSFIPMPCVMDGFRNQHTYEIKKWKDIKKGFTHFEEGDIGVAKITPCFQNRKSVIFRNLKNGYGAGTTELTVVRTINKTVLPEYLLWFFKTDYFITNGVKSFTGTAGQQRIHKDYLATCLIPLPPLAEQKRIVAKLEEILPLCERLKRGENYA